MACGNASKVYENFCSRGMTDSCRRSVGAVATIPRDEAAAFSAKLQTR
jgi:hypothetical protein